MANIDVLVATNLWWMERKEKGAHHFILRIMPLLFQTLQSLYVETQKLPLYSVSGATSKQVSGEYVINYGIFLRANDYGCLRSILSLMGDVYNLLSPLKDIKKEELMELSEFIPQLFEHSNKFREIRNFFTHLDEILTTKMEKHGITGATKTNCGIEYTTTAKGCIHLIWHNNVIYFTYAGRSHEITIEKAVFDPIFSIAKQIYLELISHKLYDTNKNYTPVEQLFASSQRQHS